jgi:hypothetical protein
VIAFAVLVAIGFERDSRKKEIAYDTFSAFDARSGGYEAWYELLEREGVAPLRFERYPAFLDDSIGTFIAANPLAFLQTETMSEANAAALARWVRAGGRVIVLGSGPLSDALGKQIALPGVALKAQKTKPFVDDSLKRLRVKTLHSASPIRFERAKGYHTLLADKSGPIVVRKSEGKGEVIAVADEQMFTNAGIAAADNARLAYALALPRNGRAVAFDESIHGHLIPEHWWQLVPRPFLVAVALTLAAVALAAIGSAVRLGPPLVPRARREVTSSEYIDALAALFERARAPQRAVHDAYVSTRRAVARKLGLADDTPDAVLAAALPHERTRADFAELARLASEGSLKDAALVHGVALAFDVRKDVGRGGR